MIVASVGLHATLALKTGGQLLWACHAGSLCLALGLLAGGMRVARAAALLLLGFAMPVYLVSEVSLAVRVLSGRALVPGGFQWTSLLVHAVASAGAVFVIRRCSWRSGAWLSSWTLLAALLLSCLLFTDPKSNVNLVHSAVWMGFDPARYVPWAPAWLIVSALAVPCLVTADLLTAHIRREHLERQPEGA